jgi:hypothetical protein
LIADGVKVPAKLGLAHEMGHAIQCNNSPSAVEKISDDDLEDLTLKDIERPLAEAMGIKPRHRHNAKKIKLVSNIRP